LNEDILSYENEPQISLYRSATGGKDWLNMEDYIMGVVAAEIGSEFPYEALKAQAIVARSMTLALMELEGSMQKKHGTDASDDHTEFQAYRADAITDEIRRAVAETRGIILTHNGNFAYTLFHSTSDSMTASIEEAFPSLIGSAPYLLPVETNGITRAPEKYQNWQVQISQQEAAAAMGLQGKSLTDLSVSEYGPSGRALTLSANGGQVTKPAVEFRKAIGFDRLYSTCFHSIQLKDGQVLIEGSGWGHGAGMEQWGAYAMAEEGADAFQILKHYFPELQLTQLYE